jgi:ABC-type multidrug transport system ATPase subunit
MLDPRGRRGIRRICREMHERGTTVVLITHFMEEALSADRVFVLHEGSLALSGEPRDVFADPARLRSLDLALPFSLELKARLADLGIDLGDALTTDEVVDALCR